MVREELLHLVQYSGLVRNKVLEELGPPSRRDPDQLVSFHVAPEFGARMNVTQILTERNDRASRTSRTVQICSENVARLQDLIELVQLLDAQRLARINPLGVDGSVPVGFEETPRTASAERFQVSGHYLREFRKRKLKENLQ